MDRSTFEARLRTAAQRAILFARQYVQQRLPDDVAFVIYPNQSYDGNPHEGEGLVVAPDGRLFRGAIGRGIDITPSGLQPDFNSLTALD